MKRRILWFPIMETFGWTVYWFCTDAAPSSPGAPRTKVSRSRTEIQGSVAGDSLTCLTWELRGVPRVSCNGRFETQILTEGTWTDGAISGTYRVLLPSLPRVGTRAIVQWITPAAGPGMPGDLHAQAELPTGKGIRPGRTTIELRNEGWRVVVRTVATTWWDKERWLTFELGAPGQLRQIPNL